MTQPRQDEGGEMSDKPHGPVGERFMRHHYGPSGYVSLANRLRRIASGEWTLRGDEDHLRLAADLLAAPQPDEAVALLRALEFVLRYYGGDEADLEHAINAAIDKERGNAKDV